jgi:fumarate reductase flavoprotein subunit
VGFILIDGRLARQFSAWPHFVSTAPGVAYAYVPDYRRNRPDVYAEAESIAELARKLGMDPHALQEAITRHNTGVASTDQKARRAPLAEPPFVALGPVRSVFVHNEGGLVVDREHRVLGAQDQPIPGLYAAGATGQGGLLLKGHGHHLAWAFVSGRRAGKLAALRPVAPASKAAA